MTAYIHFFKQKLRLTRILCLALFMGLMLSGCGSTLWPSDENTDSASNQEMPQPEGGGQPNIASIKTENDDFTYPNASDENQVQNSPHRPILTIYFKDEQTAYQRSLLKVIEAVLPHKPNAQFELFIISPSPSIAELQRTQKYGFGVRDSLLDMGISPNHLRIYRSVLPISFPQVMLFVR